MKLYKSLLMFAVAAIAFCSCSDEGYWEPYEFEAIQYSFAQSKQTFNLTADQSVTSISVAVYRSTTEGVDTLPLAITISDASVFECDSAVIFANGENIAELNITVNEENIVMGTNYTVEYAFAIDDVNFSEKNVSVSGNSSHAISLKKDYTWLSLGVGVYASQLFGESWDQPVLYAKEQPNRYRLPDCIYKGYPFEFLLSEDGQELVEWDPQATGYKHANYGMMYFYPTGMVRQGNTLSFPMLGLVVYNGALATLYSGFVETIVLPSAE